MVLLASLDKRRDDWAEQKEERNGRADERKGEREGWKDSHSHTAS